MEEVKQQTLYFEALGKALAYAGAPSEAYRFNINKKIVIDGLEKAERYDYILSNEMTIVDGYVHMKIERFVKTMSDKSSEIFTKLTKEFEKELIESGRKK